MTAQFNVYRNTSAYSNHLLPYYVIIQHDCYEDLHTRVFVPLMKHPNLPSWHNPVAPRVNIEFESLVLYSPMISHIAKNQIKPKDFICSLKPARQDIVAALDSLITNT